MSKERELLKKILATGWLNNTISCEVEKLLAQPETGEVHEEPPTTDGDPDVYTSSPMTHREAYLRGYEKAVGALKREPLSDEAVLNLVVQYSSRNELARAIEKAHSITGVDDE